MLLKTKAHSLQAVKTLYGDWTQVRARPPLLSVKAAGAAETLLTAERIGGGVGASGCVDLEDVVHTVAEDTGEVRGGFLFQQ